MNPGLDGFRTMRAFDFRYLIVDCRRRRVSEFTDEKLTWDCW